jgi:osmotically-inducible protein OsmY
MAIITISRGTFSGGMMLAESLAERLGYRNVGREEIIETASSDYGVSADRLLKAILKKPSPFQRFTYEREQYLAIFQAELCQHARADNMIYHGNAGHLLLKGVPHVLRVRIVAPMELRIKFVMERQQVLREDAVKYIEKVDKERMKWTKFLYGVDWQLPELYDIVFNFETENNSFVTTMIEYAVRQEPFKTTVESQKAMEDLALSSQVRAAIASNSDARDVEITVKADAGTVSITGKVKTQETADLINEIAAAVPGVKKVENSVELNYRYQHIDS